MAVARCVGVFAQAVLREKTEAVGTRRPNEVSSRRRWRYYHMCAISSADLPYAAAVASEEGVFLDSRLGAA